MPRARTRARLLTAILSPLLFVALLETGLRIAGYRYRPAAVEREEETRRLPPALYARHPVLLWTLPPDTIVDDPAAGFPRVATNRLGLRGNPPSGSRRPGEFRVLCLGDSVTFGLGVRDGETWPAQLERALVGSPTLGGRPVHVLSGAVPGWSSVQGLRLLDELPGYEADVVVFWFGMNDVLPAWGRPDAEKGGYPGLLDRVAWSLEGLRTVQLATRIRDAYRSPRKAVTRASVADFAGAVERLRGLETAGGPRVIFVRYPERIDATTAQLARVVERAEALSVGWVAGPTALLLPITPASDRVVRSCRIAPGPHGAELQFGGVVEMRRSLDEVRSDLATTRAWKEGLTERLALLPTDAPGAKALFGGAPPATVFSDNCHLTPEGCRRAGRAIAAMILERLPEPR